MFDNMRVTASSTGRQEYDGDELGSFDLLANMATSAVWICVLAFLYALFTSGVFDISPVWAIPYVGLVWWQHYSRFRWILRWITWVPVWAFVIYIVSITP